LRIDQGRQNSFMRKTLILGGLLLSSALRAGADPSAGTGVVWREWSDSDRAWLTRARGAADFIAATFVVEGTPGFVAAVPKSRFAPPRPQRDENVLAARFLNLLFRYTGDERYRREADQAMRFLASRDVAEKFPTASVLLAGAELSSEPAHLTVVGARDDARARALLLGALAYPAACKRVELWDRREGPLPNSDVDFPELDAPAAFACAGGRCSLPSYTPGELRKRAARLQEGAGPQ
jgi:uncharacterized protein YyaL (SSP411 family)